MDLNEVRNRIKAALAKDNIEEALNLLSQFYNRAEFAEVIINLSANYHRLEKEKISGGISNQDYYTALNNIRLQILGFLRVVEEDNTNRHKLLPQVKKADDEAISVFFSVGSPYNQSQVSYIARLKEYLIKYRINLITLEGEEWSNVDPLKPIREKMIGCFGCLVLALERTHVIEGLAKRGSPDQKAIENQNYSTPWTHIEAAMAYQLDLPFLILKDKNIKSEGMLDDILFEWRIVQIDSANSEDFKHYPINSFIRLWVEEIKKNMQNKKLQE
jgi:hypothetical protein